MTEQQNTPDQNDPNTPLEQVSPVPLDEVDAAGDQPPRDWGTDRPGEDEDPGKASEAVPQDGE